MVRHLKIHQIVRQLLKGKITVKKYNSNRLVGESCIKRNMSETEEQERSLKPPTFDGDQEKYSNWKTKACAYMTWKKCYEATLPSHETKIPEKHDTPSEKVLMLRRNKKQQRATKSMAVAIYTLSFTSNQLVNKVSELSHMLGAPPFHVLFM